MAYELSNLKLSEMTQLGAALRSSGSGAKVMEDVAQRVVHLLYDGFVDRATAAKSCVLVRFYLTMNYGDLDPELRAFGAKLMESHQLSPETRCLTLIATCGEKNDWNSRKKSAGHQCIPLPSENVVQTIPMIAQLRVRGTRCTCAVRFPG